jgi:serpin B
MGHVNERSGLTLIQFSFITLVIVVALTVFAVISAGVTDHYSRLSQYPSMPADLQAASDANGHFAIDLYRRLAESEPEENLFISPFSISPVLTMVAEGAIDQTRDQMLDALHVPNGELDKIHRGQRGLQTAAVPAIPPDFTEKLESLRSELKQVEVRYSSLIAAERGNEAIASEPVRDRLRQEIKTLVSRVSVCELRTANALWLEKTYPVEASFISTVQPNYGMAVFPVDFKGRPEPACQQINQWIAEQTNNRIQDLLSPGSITSRTRLVVTSAVYFKGDWAQPFMTYDTYLQNFRQSNDHSVELQMMHQENTGTASYGAFTGPGDLFPTAREVRFDMKNDDPSLYPDAKGHTMLALDYKAHKIQMILLVPQSATGIAELEKSLSYDTLQRWIGKLELRPVNVTIPKFKFESKLGLAKTLMSMGMRRPFENPQDNLQGAQFDNLTSSQEAEDRVYISDVVHQTYVDVSELGTEAAAATAVSFPCGDDIDRPPETRPFIPFFIADKPFIFLIRDRETASILFLGRYVSPTP